MAFKVAELYADITTRTTRFARGMRGVQAQLQKAQQSMERVARTARRMLLAAGAAALGVTVVFGRFEKTMARVQAITGASADEFKKLSGAAKELGRTTMFSAKQVADAMAFLAVAGFEVNEIISAMPHVLDLAAAGQLDMATAADITAKILRGMGLETEELAHTVDVLAKAFTTSNTTLEQLGEAMKFVGPMAKSTGKDIEEVVAVIQVLSNAGIQASMAGTTLRNIFARLSGGVPEAKKRLDALGISIVAVGGRMRSTADIVDQINVRLKGFGEAERAARIMMIFGQRAGPGMLVLLSQGGDAIRAYQKQLEGVSGTVRRIAEVQMATLWGAFTRLKSAAEGVALVYGSTLKPTVEWLTGGIQGLVDRVNALDESKRKLIVRLVHVASGIAAVLVVAPLLLASLSALAGVVVFLAANPLVLLVAGLGAVAGAYAYVTAEGDTFKEKILNIFDKVLFAYATAETVVKNWRDTLRLAFLRVALDALKLGLDLKHLYTVQIPAYLSWFADHFVEIVTDIRKFADRVLRNLFTNAKNFFVALWKMVHGQTAGLEFIWTPLAEGFKRTLAEFPEIAKREITAVETAIQVGIDALAKRMSARVAKRHKDLRAVWGLRAGLPEEPAGFPGADLPPGAPSPVPPGIPGAPAVAPAPAAAPVAVGAAPSPAAFIGLIELARKAQIAALKPQEGKKDARDKERNNLLKKSLSAQIMMMNVMRENLPAGLVMGD